MENIVYGTSEIGPRDNSQAEPETRCSMRITSSYIKVLGAVSLLFIDVISIGLSLLAAYELRVDLLPLISPVFHAVEPLALLSRLSWIIILVLVALAYDGLYVKHLPFWRETKLVVKSVSFAFLMVAAIMFLNKIGSEFSRIVIVLTYLFTLFILPLGRYLGKLTLIKLGLWGKPVIIMGASRTGELLASGIIKDPYLGYKIHGFLDDDPAIKQVVVDGSIIPVIGTFDEAVSISRTMGIDRVMIAAPGMEGPKLVALVNHLQSSIRSVIVVPDLFGIPVLDCNVEYFFNERLLAFRTNNNLVNPISMASKRVFDLLMGSVFFLLSLPIMLVLVILIRLDSPGSAIYSQKRLGRNGQVFRCYKLRSMYVESKQILNDHLSNNPDAQDEWDQYAKLRGDDPRVTRVGRCIRRLSLDELPQIINALQGHMSLVGPRPYMPSELERMNGYEKIILSARPGLTGLWQVNGRNEIDFEGRLQMDDWYVHNWSHWLDISIIFRTIPAMARRDGAY